MVQLLNFKIDQAEKQEIKPARIKKDKIHPRVYAYHLLNLIDEMNLHFLLHIKVAKMSEYREFQLDLVGIKMDINQILEEFYADDDRKAIYCQLDYYEKVHINKLYDYFTKMNMPFEPEKVVDIQHFIGAKEW